MNTRGVTILLVDDADDTRLITKWFLGNLGYEVEAVRSAEEALMRFDPKTHNLVLTDNSMPNMTGAEMAHIIKLRSASTPVLMYTGRPPAGLTCVDMVIQRPTHLLVLSDAVAKLVADKPKPEERASE